MEIDYNGLTIGKNLLYGCDRSKADDDFVDAIAYCMNDIQITNDYWKFVNIDLKNMSIKKVIFNDPATIVIWSDNTKTIVKCSKYDTFDPEKGLAMAVCKRALGDKFKQVFKEWVPEEEESELATLYADGICLYKFLSNGPKHKTNKKD